MVESDANRRAPWRFLAVFGIVVIACGLLTVFASALFASLEAAAESERKGVGAREAHATVELWWAWIFQGGLIACAGAAALALAMSKLRSLREPGRRDRSENWSS